jgi:hypothetical protein
MASATVDPVWISQARARRLLAVSHIVLTQLIARREIGLLKVPGARPKVRRQDVESILAESTLPAVAGREGRRS